MTKTILITGATGTVSTAVLNSLQGSKTKLRALVRNEAKAEALKAKGIDVVIGDLEQPKTLSKAFDGVDTAWVLATNGPRAPENTSNAIWAARRAGVSHVVRMSAVGAAHHAPTINSRLHALSDAELAASGMPYTILKPHFFMQNLMGWAQAVAKESTLAMAMGEGRMGMIDVRDIGEFAAKVLTSGGHEGKTYSLTGPQSISMATACEQLGAALKKTVTYMPLTLEQSAGWMASVGMDAYSVNMMSDYFAAYGNNWGDFVSKDFDALMGKAPRSFADFSRDFAGVFGGQ